MEIRSSGDGGVYQDKRMGIYIRTNQKAQGFPVYQQKINKLNQRQFLFVGPDKNWRVGPDTTTYEGTGLKNEQASSLPPQTGWQYWKDNWINDDSIQVVESAEGEIL